MKLNHTKYLVLLSFLTIISCDQFEVASNDPIPYSSDQIKYDNLVAKISFEDNVADSKGNLSDGVPTNITYVQGVKGKAYQGANSAFIAYNTVSDKIENLKSITVSFWINTVAHPDGAQGLYSIVKAEDGDFWGNNTVMIESNPSSNALMPFKTFLQKNRTTPDNDIDKWIEFLGDNGLFGAYNNWTHIAWTFDGITSRYTLYVNGQNVTSEAIAILKIGTTDTGIGFLNFDAVDKFVIGGFQQHLGSPWNAPEVWMKNYTGAMDEFRIYDASLTATDIFRLYTFEKEGL